MTENIHILMTGAGAPGAAGILQCLWQQRSAHITVADANPGAVGRYLNKDFCVIPRAEDPSFVDHLLSICREKNIHVVMPLVTRELVPLAKRAEEFAIAGARLVLSPLAALEIAIDKGRLYQFLQWRGIATPDFRIVENMDQFEKAASELGYPGGPFCFKPCLSNGSRGFRVIRHDIDPHWLLFHEKPDSTIMTYEEATRVLSKAPFPELLVSEYLPGREFSVDCLARDGEPVLIVPRWRKKMVNGISVEGEFINDEKIIAYCAGIIRSLKLHGNIGIQLKEAESGQALILEINPRVQGTIVAALGAGVNLPVLAIRQELGLPIHEDELQVKWGTKFSRYWTEVFYT